MRLQVAFDDIKLLDHDGNVDDAAFMRFKQELWKADRVRLALLIERGGSSVKLQQTCGWTRCGPKAARLSPG